MRRDIIVLTAIAALVLIELPIVGLHSGAALGPTDLGPSPAPAFTTNPVDATRWAAEPMIVAGPGTRLVATAAAGFSRYAFDPVAAVTDAGQSYIWTSTDSGATWRYAGLQVAGVDTPIRFRNAVLGVEGDVDVDSAGSILHVDLVPFTTVGFGKSTDAGATWGTGNPAAIVQTSADRPWVAAGSGSNVYATVDPLKVYKSVDGGGTFPVSVSFADDHTGKLIFDSTHNDLIIPRQGSLSVLDATTLQAIRTVYLPGFSSSDREVAGVAEAGLASDGAVYIAYARAEGGGVNVYAVETPDLGLSWRGPWKLNAAGTTAALPTVGAGFAGRAGFGWYEAPGTFDPSSTIADWHYRASVTDSLHTPSAAADVYGGIVHHGAICLTGSDLFAPLHRPTLPDPNDPCGSETGRRLLDFTGADVTPTGKLVIAYTTTTLASATGQPRVMFASTTT